MRSNVTLADWSVYNSAPFAFLVGNNDTSLSLNVLLRDVHELLLADDGEALVVSTNNSVLVFRFAAVRPLSLLTTAARAVRCATFRTRRRALPLR